MLRSALLGPLAPVARRHGAAQARHRQDQALLSFPPTIASRSCPAPTPAPSRWRCGPCSARAASTCWRGRISASAGSATSSAQLQLADARVLEADYGRLPDLGASISTATSSSPGTAPRPACACRTATGSPHVAAGSHSPTPPRRVFAQDDRLAQSRCRHLLVAEGAGRRSRARHVHPVAARGGAPRELRAAVAAAQAVPPHAGRPRSSMAFSKA